MPGHQGYTPIQQMDNSLDGRNGLPSTHSSQQLMPNDTDSVTVSETERTRVPAQYGSLRSIAARDWFTVGVLCFVNLINYMDRFTIAGVLTPIQSDFKISDEKGGLLQTVFVLSYMICAPVFGYFGDRYSRRWIMASGVFLWSATTLIGSFMNHFGWFITFRALVGIGEASYSTIAPTIISDLFVHDIRSKMLALFYFAIPVGSGLGYIVGSETAHLAGSWRWALRVTPALGAIAVAMILLIKEPIRGQSEQSHNLETTSYKEDLKDLIKNRSFMLSTCGFTCVAFVAGALAWWGPKFIHLGLKMQPGNEHITLNEVSYKFGIVAMMSGLIGVPLGSFMAQTLRPRIQNVDPLVCAWGLLVSSPLVVSFTFGALTMAAGLMGVVMGSFLSQTLIKRFPTIDPLLCAGGLLTSVPLLAGAMIVVSKNSVAAYTLVFLGQLALNINWAIVADILLYVVVPTRRSTAEAFQILISHAFGDAGSPFLVGVISEAIKAVLRNLPEVSTDKVTDGLQSLALTVNATLSGKEGGEMEEDTNKVKFQALQYALFSTSFVEVIGGIFFLLTALYILKDKSRATQIVKDAQEAEVNNTYADTNVIA